MFLAVEKYVKKSVGGCLYQLHVQNMSVNFSDILLNGRFLFFCPNFKCKLCCVISLHLQLTSLCNVITCSQNT